jgi:hypothetical protein
MSVRVDPARLSDPRPLPHPFSRGRCTTAEECSHLLYNTTTPRACRRLTDKAWGGVTYLRVGALPGGREPLNQINAEILEVYRESIPGTL